jgi:hypothetical protein
MAFEIVLTEGAEDVLFSLRPHDQSAVLAHLNRLAESPSTLSRPTVPFLFASPYGMQSEFQGLLEDGKCEYFVIFFNYSQDEKSLIVGDIGHWPLDSDAPIRDL